MHNSENEYLLGMLRPYYGTNLRGIFTASDPSELELRGTMNDVNQEYIEISFVPCARSESLECASEQEVKAYLATKVF